MAVSKLWRQGYSLNEISRKMQINLQKTRKILITLGEIDTEEAVLFRQGLTQKEIAEKLQKTESAVNARLPYGKGMYNAEYPSRNALKIRKSRERD